MFAKILTIVCKKLKTTQKSVDINSIEACSHDHEIR